MAVFQLCLLVVLPFLVFTADGDVSTTSVTMKSETKPLTGALLTNLTSLTTSPTTDKSSQPIITTEFKRGKYNILHLLSFVCAAMFSMNLPLLIFRVVNVKFNERFRLFFCVTPVVKRGFTRWPSLHSSSPYHCPPFQLRIQNLQTGRAKVERRRREYRGAEVAEGAGIWWGRGYAPLKIFDFESQIVKF